VKRRFQIGDKGDLSGVHWRIEEGRKGPEDKVLEIVVPEVCKVPMGLGLLMAQFFFDNEEHLYPQAYGYRGGFLYLDVCAKAALQGWEAGTAELDRLRGLASDRRART